MMKSGSQLGSIKLTFLSKTFWLTVNSFSKYFLINPIHPSWENRSGNVQPENWWAAKTEKNWCIPKHSSDVNRVVVSAHSWSLYNVREGELQGFSLKSPLFRFHTKTISEASSHSEKIAALHNCISSSFPEELTTKDSQHETAEGGLWFGLHLHTEHPDCSRLLICWWIK